MKSMESASDLLPNGLCHVFGIFTSLRFFELGLQKVGVLLHIPSQGILISVIWQYVYVCV